MSAYVESLFIIPHLTDRPTTNSGMFEYIKTHTLTVENKKKWEAGIANVNNRANDTLASDHSSPPTSTMHVIHGHVGSIRVNPRQRDTLFWCVFIAVNGYDEYLKVDYGYGSRELDIKREIGDYLSKHASEIKNANIKITKSMVQEICSELITNINTTSIECLVAISVYYHINLILVDDTNKIRLEVLSDTSMPNYLLYKDSYGKYSVQCEALSETELETIRKTTVCLENHIKPIRQIGAYTIGKLIEMAETLGVMPNTGGNTIKYKKQDLYVLVACKMVWTGEPSGKRKVG